ncbi:hypothetical protein OSB04_003172 [Centaurea solstitialis]|uniref:Glutamate receptor n=1 Tax=Centaurea solstitialis TaxID=347529 RepID=A0AA38U4T3_9ASTR|nr:hypothetical protein OSB04_003172 [Centaurea solstitialis]
MIQPEAQEDLAYKEIPVGVILDMGSWVGKTVHSCIAITLSEFYKVNSHYQTRIVVHNRDTQGETLHALHTALELLKKTKVQAIIGSDSTAEAKFLAVLGDEARIPILSLSPTPPSNNHPYFLQIAHDETIQFKGIAAMAESFGWKNLIVICEDTDNGRDMATFMANALGEKSISVTYRSLVSTSASDEVVHEELQKLSTMQTKVFVLHTSPSLASYLLLNAKYLGMMGEGYKWIITSKTMDFMNYMDGEVMESMQGVVGFKSYIPQSRDLEKFTLKWKEEYSYPLMEVKNINAYGIWAHDAVSALAMAVEKQVLKSNMKNLETTGSSQRGIALLNQMSRISFQGLGGVFQFRNGRITTDALEIINVIGKGEKRVGFWTTDAAFSKNIGKPNSFFDPCLEGIIWPGGISTNPPHRMLQISNKSLRIGVPLQSRPMRLFQVSYDAQTNSTNISGFVGDVFQAAFSALSSEVVFQFIPFTNNAGLGELNYNHLIDRVHAREFDVAVGDITITANRSLYVDFTLPYTDLGLGVLSRNANASMWIFMKPLSSELWVVSGCFFILLGFVIWILEHRRNEEFQGEKLQSNLSRFVVSVWMFVVLILVSSYTATLSSLLTVEQIQLASKGSSIGYYPNGPPMHGFMVRSFDNKATRLKPYSTAEEYVDALSRGSKKGGVDAIVDEIPYLKEFLTQYPSGYYMTVSEAITSGFGFAFPQGSPLAPEISRQITRLREDGTLKVLEDKWFNFQQSGSSSKDSAPKILNLQGLRGLFLISGVSMAAALFIFMLYRVHEKMRFTYTMLAGGKLGSIMRISSTVRAYGDKIADEMIVRKILRSSSPNFDHVAEAIEESNDLAAYFVDQLIGSLQTHKVSVNNHYNTRITPHCRDNYGEPSHALPLVNTTKRTRRFILHGYPWGAILNMDHGLGRPFIAALPLHALSAAQEVLAYKEIPVGVILDMGSWVGKTVHSCITIALSEFYKVNDHYQTRIVVHNKDTQGETLHALHNALELLQKKKVQAIIGSDSTKFLAVLGDEARIPILSLSPTPSSHNHPYFLQIAPDETIQFNGIAAMAESFGWKNLIVICEDTDNGRDMATFMANALGEKSISVLYRSLILTSASDKLVQEELRKLSTMQTKIFVLHTSPSIASNLLLNAKYLGMMDVGYKWIISSKTMDFLNIMDGEVMESMQGVVGFKSYIPQSRDLYKFMWKWREEYPLMEVKNINAYGIWAHDAVSALAMAIEKQVLKSNMKNLETTVSGQWGTELMNQMLRISFQGLGGAFEFRNGRINAQVVEIINVIGKGEQRVGFWSTDAAFTKKIGTPNSYFDHGLEPIIWPGGIRSNPRHRMLQMSSKKLRIGIPMPLRSGRVFQVNYDAQTNSTVISGFVGDVFQAAFSTLGGDVTYRFIPLMNKGKAGTRNYDSLIDQVHAGEFDVGIGDITITSNRCRYVDFTLPYTDIGVGILSRNADASMWIFMKPLSSELWVVSACFFILLGFVIWVFEHQTNEEFQGSPTQQIGTTFWFAFSTLVYAHAEKLQSNLSRFVVIVWLFVVLVLTSSYTATLSSLLTIEQLKLGSNVNSFGYQYGSVMQEYMVEMLNVNETGMKSYSTLKEQADALTRGSNKGGVDAIIDEILYIKEFLTEYPSGYSMLASSTMTNGFGFAFPQGSPLAPQISRRIAWLREDGTLKMLEEKWFNQESGQTSKDSAPKILNLQGLRGLFLISGVSMATCLFIFMLHSKAQEDESYKEIPVGVTLDMGSWVGKTVHGCITTAVSDFYTVNSRYKTRITPQYRDTCMLYLLLQPNAQDDSSYTEIPVGVILNMRSVVGKTVYSCITIALSEFYKVNSHYETRIVVHNRDTHGETLHALRTAFELLEKTKVQAIIGSDSAAEANLLAVLGDEARTPILSLSPSPIPSFHNHPYFLQIAHDETIQFKGIAAMAESFGWKNLIVVCEDTDNGRDMATYMSTAFREKGIYVTYRSLISTSASNELVQEELHKFLTMQTKVFVLHTSPSLASYLLLNAKDLGMMDEGYKWIVTSKTMDFISSMDGEVMESMQGAVGFRSYIPQSSDLHKFTWKWRKEYNGQNPLMEVKDVNAYAIWAHDAVSALAISVEKREAVKSKSMEMSGSRQKGTTLLNQMLRISFQGLGGVFQFMNGRVTAHALEIVNVIGKREHRVGFWTKDASFTQKIGKPNSFSHNGLKAIIWPGGISSHSMRLRSKKLRIVVPQHSNSRRLIQVNYDARTNSTVISGFCAEVFLAAFDAFSQDVAFDFIPFMNHTEVGIKNYNDLIDLVHSGEFDAAIGDITITANRSQYVDFTLPFTDLGLAKLSRNADASMWIFMEPLSSNLWLVSACYFILLALVIWILEHRTNQEFQGSRGQQIGKTIWFAFSTLVYAHRQELQSNLSRFVLIVWLFFVLVLTSSYSATLSSLLTIQQIQLASKTTSIGYSYYILKGGIKNFTPGTKVESYPTIEAYADDLSRGSKKGGVDAIVEEIPYVKGFLAEYPSGYSMTVYEVTTNGFGFAFARGSPWAPVISRQIARLREDGTLSKLENKWFNQESRDFVPTTKILSVKDLRGLFVISGGSMAAALFLFMIYSVHEKLHFSYTMLAGGKLAFILRLLVRKTGIAGLYVLNANQMFDDLHPRVGYDLSSLLIMDSLKKRVVSKRVHTQFTVCWTQMINVLCQELPSNDMYFDNMMKLQVSTALAESRSSKLKMMRTTDSLIPTT